MGQMNEANTMTELFEAFRDEAMRIDPTITDFWVFTDELIHDMDRDKRLAGIQFRRHATETRRKAA